MDDKKFWKIVYLYTTKYNNEVLYYREEKQDIWLINHENEITRLIYNDKLDNPTVDANVYNIIKNEKRLKKHFKLSSLKIKILHFSKEENDIQEYKKYKVSEELLVERVVVSEKNIHNFIKKGDIKFVDISVDSDRYQNRVVDRYKYKDKKLKSTNIYFNLIAIFFVLLFLLNYILLYYSKGGIYKYFEYNYQNIISGQFYRLYTDIFIFQNSLHLIFIVGFIVLCSVLLNEELSLKNSIIILLAVSLFCNLFLILNQIQYTNTINLSFFGLLGAMFIFELNKRNDNLKFIYTAVMPIIYLILLNLISDFKISIGMYMFAFILGIFVQIALLKGTNSKFAIFLISLVVVLGIFINIFGIDMKSSINNYRLNSVNERLLKVNRYTSTEKLELEINSNNKSILSYYELGMMKITTSTVQEAKKVFLDGINFDDKFAPIYYQLALIEYKESNYSKSLEYIDKAIKLDKDIKYLNFREEINSKG
ncbi:rhomboid family intramembrane serine protease [Gemella sp. zg-1178]|uniref:rhomboid family intramembrane serine protease n=1 Tax=Gemella sp. zg-1178 TaxID=2840372 RepID=UPI001C04599C|nr:rhomboid family intramembrane serine protease [Gemella sp. zg-1178]MBU0278276.1 hypothetical protein [Gemella sp. zg-1178]